MKIVRTATVAAFVVGTALSAAALEIKSAAFQPNGPIPSKYTCDGAGVNPALSFSGVPAKAQSLVLIMDDPDVPKNLMPSGVFDHWLIWNLPATTKGFAEAAPEEKTGLNGMGQQGYVGPCPPDREHRYFFKLYALDANLTATITNKAELEAAMKGHVLEQAELIGRYART